MRDPNRIKPTLEAVERFWLKNPDLRLGQLIWALSQGKDPFYLEDELLVAEIQYRLGEAEPDFESIYQTAKQKFTEDAINSYPSNLPYLSDADSEKLLSLMENPPPPSDELVSLFNEQESSEES